MAVPDSDDLRTKFSISTQISDARLDMCMDDALDTVRVKLGIEAFDEVFNAATDTIDDSIYLDENITTTDETALRLSRATRAVFYYAIADVVLNTSLHIRATGMIKKEQDAGSPGMNSSSQIINEYLTAKEAQEYAAWLTGKADGLIEQYVVVQPPPNISGFGRLVRC